MAVLDEKDMRVSSIVRMRNLQWVYWPWLENFDLVGLLWHLNVDILII